MKPQPLTCQGLMAVLDSWAGRRVAVRVVSEANDLLTVSHGVLGPRSEAKRPSVWWPLDEQERDPGYESPGIWLHPHRFGQARFHPPRSVVDFEHSGVKVSMRLLDD